MPHSAIFDHLKVSTDAEHLRLKLMFNKASFFAPLLTKSVKPHYFSALFEKPHKITKNSKK